MGWGGGVVTGVLSHPDGSHCSPPGVKTPVTKRPPPIYVCKRKTWFAYVTKLSPVFVYEHRLLVFVIELFFILKKCGTILLWAEEEKE